MVDGLHNHCSCYPTPQHQFPPHNEKSATLNRVLNYLPWGAMRKAMPGHIQGPNEGSFTLAAEDNLVLADPGTCFE